jgi:hypothetical protein
VLRLLQRRRDAPLALAGGPLPRRLLTAVDRRGVRVGLGLDGLHLGLCLPEALPQGRGAAEGGLAGGGPHLHPVLGDARELHEAQALAHNLLRALALRAAAAR